MAFIARVIPGEANWWTQERTASSKWRVSPASISRPSQANKNRDRTATARLTMIAASNRGVGFGASSGPETCVCGSGICGVGAPGGHFGDQVIQFRQQRLIPGAWIRPQLLSVDG